MSIYGHTQPGWRVGASLAATARKGCKGHFCAISLEHRRQVLPHFYLKEKKMISFITLTLTENVNLKKRKQCILNKKKKKKRDCIGLHFFLICFGRSDRLLILAVYLAGAQF